MKENEIIKKIVMETPSHHKISLGPGDDCALPDFSLGKRNRLVTSDMLMDGKHFKLSKHTLDQVLNKAFAVNCSDIYAMGGIPTLASLCLALPSELDKGKLIKAISTAVRKYKLTIIGGDTNTWDGPLVISICMEGFALKTPILRSNAQIGDSIFVTGSLGGSMANDRHLSPPDLRILMTTLVEKLEINAMIDLSDGLATDLRHILKLSKKGAHLFQNQIPIHKDAANSVSKAMCDGEDYELCFTVNSVEEEKMKHLDFNGRQIYKIGHITGEKNIIKLEKNNQVNEFLLTGFEH